jgi:hypothetical protein
MMPPTTQNRCEISQDIEKAVDSPERCEDTLKFRNVPQPPTPDGNLTKGRKLAISSLLILSNSILVR